MWTPLFQTPTHGQINAAAAEASRGVEQPHRGGSLNRQV